MVLKRTITRKKKAGTKYRLKKKAVARKKAVVPRNMVALGKGFPKKLTVTHKYVENISAGFTSTAGSLATYSFRLNSLFDPNETGTGHQPMYFDQVSALYNHYHVIGAKAVIKITPETTTTNTSRCAVYTDDNGTVTPTSLDTIAEQTLGKGIKYFLAGNNNYQTFVCKWSARKTFGKGVLANNDLGALAGANPAELSHLVIACQADDVATIGFNFTIHLEQIAVWTELKDIASS